MPTADRAAITLRAADVEDAQCLSALSIQVWLSTYATRGVSAAIARHVLCEFSPAHFVALSDAPGVSLWVAEANSHLVGYALVNGGEAHVLDGQRTSELCTLYVQEPFTGKGIGSRLLNAALDHAGAGHLWLAVNAGNLRAQAFYRKHNFSVQGTRPFVLDGVGHENHIMVPGLYKE